MTAQRYRYRYYSVTQVDVIGALHRVRTDDGREFILDHESFQNVFVPLMEPSEILFEENAG